MGAAQGCRIKLDQWLVNPSPIQTTLSSIHQANTVQPINFKTSNSLGISYFQENFNIHLNFFLIIIINTFILFFFHFFFSFFYYFDSFSSIKVLLYQLAWKYLIQHEFLLPNFLKILKKGMQNQEMVQKTNFSVGTVCYQRYPSQLKQFLLMSDTFSLSKQFQFFFFFINFQLKYFSNNLSVVQITLSIFSPIIYTLFHICLSIVRILSLYLKSQRENS
ncbi:hypothetical protein ABPG74_013825 [Tetrahymena malaccensis]